MSNHPISCSPHLPRRRSRSVLRILQDIRLEVQRGECIAITDQSGSGKTTLLSLLGALDSPDG